MDFSPHLAALLVLAAAVMHAAWNAMVKASGDRAQALARIDLWALLLALAATPWVPFPPARIWPYILASAALALFYRVLLVAAYNRGDLGQVYPLMRGAAPLLLAPLAVIFAGEPLSAAGYTGVALVSAGILSLVTWSALDRRQLHAVVFSLLASITIACYTLVDGLGVRASGDVLMYVVWLEVIEHVPLPAWFLAARRETPAGLLLRQWKTSMVGAANKLGAYGLVLWAVTLTAIAQVAALRETSVVIAAVIGHFLFREPFGRKRILASLLVAAGIVLLQFGRG